MKGKRLAGEHVANKKTFAYLWKLWSPTQLFNPSKLSFQRTRRLPVCNLSRAARCHVIFQVGTFVIVYIELVICLLVSKAELQHRVQVSHCRCSVDHRFGDVCKRMRSVFITYARLWVTRVQRECAAPFTTYIPSYQMCTSHKSNFSLSSHHQRIKLMFSASSLCLTNGEHMRHVYVLRSHSLMTSAIV